LNDPRDDEVRHTLRSCEDATLAREAGARDSGALAERLVIL
jgi:hypothetical protein